MSRVDTTFDKQGQQAWQSFIKQESLNSMQTQQFENYLLLLQEWNEKINLTRIINIPDIIALHFQDSIRIKDFVDFTKKKGLCDVGSGAGFPGIPLKILFPDLPVILLEVTTKKIEFLQTVIDQLQLAHCYVCPLDWRTFLRQAPYELDIFCARASLKPEELLRMLKPGCAYNDAQLIYWASQHWQPSNEEKEFLVKQEIYSVDNQQRMYAFFEKK